MKPTLERIVAQIVASMMPEARDFYDREFGFFNEVTSISGKLKPYIKKTKPEKKVGFPELVTLYLTRVPRPKSTRRWPRFMSTSEFICLVTLTV